MKDLSFKVRMILFWIFYISMVPSGLVGCTIIQNTLHDGDPSHPVQYIEIVCNVLLAAKILLGVALMFGPFIMAIWAFPSTKTQLTSS